MATMTQDAITTPEQAHAAGRARIVEGYGVDAVIEMAHTDMGDREYELMPSFLRGAAEALVEEADAIDERVRVGKEKGTICPDCGDPEGAQCC